MVFVSETFGCQVPTLGVHVNGYVVNSTTGLPCAMWLGRRAMSKPTYPGLLDQIAAGGY